MYGWRSTGYYGMQDMGYSNILTRAVSDIHLLTHHGRSLVMCE